MSSTSLDSAPVDTAKADLAAACRMADRLGWSTGVENHFSMLVEGSKSEFFVNPKWVHFARVTVDNMATTSLDHDRNDARNKNLTDSAWFIHGETHRIVPAARCILHAHPPYATALSTLDNWTLKAIDQDSASFHNRVGYLDYVETAVHLEEGRRIAHAALEHKVLILRGHGVLIHAETIQRAFGDLYYLERACRVTALAMATGMPLKVFPDDMAAEVTLENVSDDSEYNALFEEFRQVHCS